MTQPRATGLSRARLALLDRVMTERYVASGLLPGFQTLVWHRGRLAHANLVGLADRERGEALREDALYRIYSMTKPITAVAVMMLVEEGKLGLDDEVRAHIPAWRSLGVYATGMPSLLGAEPTQYLTTPAQRPMRVIDLMTHTAGLTYGFMMRTPVDQAYRRLKVADFQTEGGLEAMIETLATLPLDFSPGTHWNYSVSIDVLGYLVEKLSGQRFGEFLRTRLFEPLGMHDTDFHCPPDQVARLTTCYQPREGGGIAPLDDGRKSAFAQPPKLESGGGGLVSSAHDYLRFCRMLLGGGTLDGVQILSPKTVELFSLNLLPGGKLLSDLVAGPGLFTESGYEGVGFSLGCAVTMDLARSHLPGSPGEFFWGGAASTAFWIDPQEDLAVVFMTQVIGSPARLTLRRDLRTLVYSAFTQQPD